MQQNISQKLAVKSPPFLEYQECSDCSSDTFCTLNALA